MLRPRLTLLLLTPAFLPFCALAQTGAIELVSPFGDNMVVQRDAPIMFRGVGEAGGIFSARFGASTAQVTVEDDGTWSAEFGSMPASGPFTLSVGELTLAENVMVGDVYLCSGQSNMEYPIHRALNPQRELGEPRDPNIRLLTVPKRTSTVAQSAVADNAAWVSSEDEALKDFSAVCYFTGRSLKQDDVAIGLVNSSWGGTRIESWMSAESLNAANLRQDDLARLDDFRRDEMAARRAFAQHWETWWSETNPESAPPWTSSERDEWKPVPGFTNWKSWGDPELETYDGQVWYRATVNLDDDKLNFDRIALGGIDEMDQVWINGTWIGGRFDWGGERNYAVPPSVLRAGANEIVVNVMSSWDRGGMYGSAETVALFSEDGSSQPIENWTYRRANRAGFDAPMAPWESVTGITGIYNSMIAPFTGLRFTAGFWYQGESNAGEPEGYGVKLASMLDGWERLFGEDMKALIIQLPEFGEMNFEPSDSGWARLRDEQRITAEARDNAALVVTLGAGDPYDIHPPNKQEVAKRSVEALAALSGAGAEPQDGTPVRADMNGSDILVTFLTDGSGLRTSGTNRAVGFELCAEMSCVFVDGNVDGATVNLSAPEDGNWTSVRYNWADTPTGNLWLTNGVPVGTFEFALGAVD